jgi:hypothetical protein
VKRLTITYDDDVELDISAIFPIAKSMLLETLEEGGDALKTNGAANGKSKADGKTRTKYFHPDLTTVQAIMKHYSPGAEFNHSTAAKWLTETGFSPSSAPGALWTLVQHNFLTRLSNDRWKFMKPMALDKKIALGKKKALE